MIHDRVPPQNIQCERLVLGSMLTDEVVCDIVVEDLQETAFYSTVHRHIFHCIRDLRIKNMPVDIVTVCGELKRVEWLEEVGAEPYISELMEFGVSERSIKHHCDCLNDLSVLRELISSSSGVMADAFEPGVETKVLLDSFAEKIFELGYRESRSDFEGMKELLPRVMDRIETYSKGVVPGLVKTGFADIDRITGGFNPGDLVIVAGRPGTGKTALVVQICSNLAKKNSGCALFSLEMSKEQIVERQICTESKIESHRMRGGMLQKREYASMGIACGPLFEMPFFIDDTPSINIIDLKSKARRLMRKNKIELIAIDYLQLMSGVEKKKDRQAEISEISRALKCTAKELNVPIIALSQLSRELEKRKDHRPMLSDLRESGALEQDSDVVLFTYCDYIYSGKPETKNITEIIVGKQRNGPTGTVELAWMPEYTLFSNIEKITGESERKRDYTESW
jgi:replicative DNA helicase